MPVSSSRLSYSDCETLFEKALADLKGCRYQVIVDGLEGDFGKTKYFVMRMHQFRALDRQDNRVIFNPGDPMYGRSVYDSMIVRIKADTEGKFWVYVVHTEIAESEIESLSELEQEAPQ